MVLSGALKQNNTLKHLHVYNCGMTDTGVALLADSLHTNNTLKTLSIYGNRVLTVNSLTWLVKILSRNW